MTHLLPGNLLLDDQGVYCILERFDDEQYFRVLDFGENDDSGIWGDWICRSDKLLTESEEWK